VFWEKTREERRREFNGSDVKSRKRAPPFPSDSLQQQSWKVEEERERSVESAELYLIAPPSSERGEEQEKEEFRMVVVEGGGEEKE
jgi:hypothetical protein